jgi:hypothetical protein
VLDEVAGARWRRGSWTPQWADGALLECRANSALAVTRRLSAPAPRRAFWGCSAVVLESGVALVACRDLTPAFGMMRAARCVWSRGQACRRGRVGFACSMRLRAPVGVAARGHRSGLTVRFPNAERVARSRLADTLALRPLGGPFGHAPPSSWSLVLVWSAPARGINIGLVPGRVQC